MFVICWINDPSLPETPGGASRTREWSLHGGAEVMRMKALRVLSRQLDESFDVCINGLLVGNLNEDPSPSDCI